MKNFTTILELNFSQDADFTRRCRLSVYEQGCLIVKGLEYGALGSFIKSFGSIVPQHDGSDIFDVKPSEDLGRIYYSRTMDAVPPHTDGHDMCAPPRFFLLFCRQPSANGDGETEVSDSAEFLELLSKQDLDILTSYVFSFETKPSSAVMKIEGVRSPIYDLKRDIFRYSYNYLSKQASGSEAAIIVERIKEFHEKRKMAVVLKKNDLMICDNHHILHSRASFSGSDRHLVRAWVN